MGLIALLEPLNHDLACACSLAGNGLGATSLKHVAEAIVMMSQFDVHARCGLVSRLRPAHHRFIDGHWRMVLQELKDGAHAETSAVAAARAAVEAEAAQPGRQAGRELQKATHTWSCRAVLIRSRYQQHSTSAHSCWVSARSRVHCS